MPRGIYFSSFRLSVRMYVRLFIRSCLRYNDKALVKVSPVMYISVTTDQKAFIFKPKLPWRVGIDSMTSDLKVLAPVWDWRSKSNTFKLYDSVAIQSFYMIGTKI